MWRLFRIEDYRAVPVAKLEALVWVMLRQPESWTRRVLDPDWYWNDATTLLLAQLVDISGLLLWAKTEDAQKGRNRPKPIPRPGVKGYRANETGASRPIVGFDTASIDRKIKEFQQG